ncbi:AmmeMemoRadiSam system protein A [Niveibacterium sp. SC-1]|uniref:AmmeMemoRadiSam system protein A n=1 Tax=Niveibacterium sp. SC-1 TaxID=3135646 RepID=UPI00311EC0E8
MRPDLGSGLVARARALIAARLGLREPDPPQHFEELEALGACFVTLKRADELRGCMGTLEAHRSLAEDLRHNALAAAFSDPRFEPLTAEEWPNIAVSVSVLGPIARTPAPSEAAALALLTARPGVVLESGARRATFLPQVWDALPEPAAFLSALRAKAGLRGPWPDDTFVGRYAVEEFTEGGRS